MLVLSRGVTQEVCLLLPPSTEPRMVTVIVGEICSGKVRLAIDAPQQVGVFRKELLDRHPEILEEAGLTPRWAETAA